VRGLAMTLDRRACSLHRRIDELLDLARGELGMLRLNCQPVDLPRLMSGIADSMASAVSNQGLSLVTYVLPSLPLLRADNDTGEGGYKRGRTARPVSALSAAGKVYGSVSQRVRAGIELV